MTLLAPTGIAATVRRGLVAFLALMSTSFVSAVAATANGSYGWKILVHPSTSRYSAYAAAPTTTYYYGDGAYYYGDGAYGDVTGHAAGRRAHQRVRKALHPPRLLF